MPRDMTVAAITQLYKEFSTHTLLWVVAVSHAQFVNGTQRFVRDNVALPYDGHTWNPAWFEVNLPQDEEQKVTELELRTIDMDRALTRELRALPLDELADVALEVVRKAPDGSVFSEIGPINLKILGHALEAETAELTLKLGLSRDFLNAPAVKDIYTPYTAPGLFR